MSTLLNLTERSVDRGVAQREEKLEETRPSKRDQKVFQVSQRVYRLEISYQAS